MPSEQFEKENNYDISRIFVRIYRPIIEDYRIHKKLTINEFVVLLWLYFMANPHNGLVNTSYSALSAELSGKFSTNEMNKLCLSLKSKKYIYFDRQQGRRSSFNILIDNYPLSCGAFKQVYDKGESISSRTEDRGDDSSQTDVPPEMGNALQKLESDKYNLVQALSVNRKTSRGRSTNIEINNYKNNEVKLKADYSKRSLNISQFEPETPAEEICKEIAENIGENNLKQLFDIKSRHGFEVIAVVYDEVRTILESENGVEDPKKFFYSRLREEIRNSSP